MLISIFKKSRVLTPVILVLVALLLWIDGFAFSGTQTFTGDYMAPLFRIIVPFIESFPLVSVVTAWLFLMLQAFIVNYVVTTKGLIDRHTLLPALIYVVLMSSTFEMLSLNPLLFANFFLILALNKIFDTFAEKDVPIEVFNVGVLISLAGLFYPPALWFFFLAIASLFVYLVGNIRGILATLMGFATPFLFLGVYYFLIDSLEQEVENLIYFPEFFKVFQYSFSYYTQTFIVFFSILFLMSFVRVTFRHINDKPVRIRKRFNILVWFFVISLLSTLTTTGFFEIHYALMLIPLSMFLAVFFMEMKKKRLTEIIFSLLLLLIVIGKLARLD